jgi:hypothetical protein
MHRSPEPINSDTSRKRELQPYHVVYLVKRPAYEFIFAVPKTPPPFSGEKKAFFEVHFRHQPQQTGVVLEWDDLKDFYDSLGRLMEYLQTERQKRQGG